jgi:hypothetical protein
LQYATPRAKASSLAPERSDATDLAAALAALHSVAADRGVGLTPHQAVIQRAMAAAETVNQRMADLQKTGGMRDMNDEAGKEGRDRRSLSGFSAREENGDAGGIARRR